MFWVCPVTSVARPDSLARAHYGAVEDGWICERIWRQLGAGGECACVFVTTAIQSIPHMAFGEAAAGAPDGRVATYARRFA